MRRTLPAVATVVAVLAAAVPVVAAGDARGALDEGFTLFAARRFDESAAKFEEAAAQARAQGLDPAVATYDRAIALLRAGRGAAAAGVFTEALRSPDPRLREAAHYQRGIALTVAAESVESGGESAKALALLEQALEAYESAMRIDPEDEDPKVNHELVSRKKAQLESKLMEPGKAGGTGGRGRPGAAADGGEPEEAERSREREPGRPAQGAQPARRGPPEQEMRPEEARTLLDALRQQEQSHRERMRPFRGEAIPVGKDW